MATTTTAAARYRYLSDDDQKHLTSTQLAVYQAERAAFDLEVRKLYARAMWYGEADVTTSGKRTVIMLPVQLAPGSHVYRDTVGIGLRGAR